MFKKKFLLLFLSVILILLVSVSLNLLNTKDFFFDKLSIKTKVILKTIKKNNQAGDKFSSIFNNFFNDYNEKFLPSTQQISLDYKVKKMIFNDNFKIDKSKISFVPQKVDSKKNHFYSFFLEQYADDIIITDYIGNIYYLNKDILEKDNKFKPKLIKSNLVLNKILDTLVVDDFLYISYGIETFDECYTWNVSKAKFNKNNLNFKNLYSSEECSKQNFYQPHGGRMQLYNLDNNPGIIITIGDNDSSVKEKGSIIGTILFINEVNNSVKIISKGHRNHQGLWSDKKNILSTEHGPRGGDEINKIIVGNNYGWPYSSYGEPYGKKLNLPKFKKNHENSGYEEPVYSFLKAIGISEIIKLPNNFSIFWQDNFILASLWGHSIHRLKFDKDYNKLIFNEKIYLGKRIRDLIYLEEKRLILLALEEKGELGILRNTAQ